jgi:hypothetical protein
MGHHRPQEQQRPSRRRGARSTAVADCFAAIAHPRSSPTPEPAAHAPPTVADTKARFQDGYKRPIPAIFNVVVQELLVQQHFVRYNVAYQYNEVRFLFGWGGEGRLGARAVGWCGRPEPLRACVVRAANATGSRRTPPSLAAGARILLSSSRPLHQPPGLCPRLCLRL